MCLWGCEEDAEVEDRVAVAGEVVVVVAVAEVVPGSGVVVVVVVEVRRL